MQLPHCQPGVWPEGIPTSRFAAHVQQALPTGCRVALLGLPDDLGVRLNNGRPGAKDGPTAFRASLARYGVAEPSEPEFHSLPRLFDAGDVAPASGDDASALQETHRRVSEASAALVRAGLLPVAVGGGHDLTFAFVRGVWQAWQERLPEAQRGAPWDCVYFDAHLDVRETVGSGMPFRRLRDEGIAGTLAIIGMNHFASSREHHEWFKANGGEQWTEIDATAFAAVRSKQAGDAGVFVSFDMDVLDQSVAPGVSAMNPEGLSVGTAATPLRSLARIPSLRCLDFMELNPAHDDNGRTARVAAHLFLIALSGLALGPLAQDRSP